MGLGRIAGKSSELLEIRCMGELVSHSLAGGELLPLLLFGLRALFSSCEPAENAAGAGVSGGIWHPPGLRAPRVG